MDLDEISYTRCCNTMNTTTYEFHVLVNPLLALTLQMPTLTTVAFSKAGLT
jgi:hypothetical protein